MASKSIAFTIFSVALAGGLVLADTVLAAPPQPVEANPVLVYLNRSGAIEVANADGSAKTVLRPNVIARRPTWDPDGTGSFTDPWYIVYEANYCIELKRFALWKNGTGLATGPDVVIWASVPPGNRCANAVDISPAQNKLVFGNNNDTAPSSLRTMNDDGSSVETPVYSPSDGSNITWASYSCDGSKIAFVENGPTGSDSIRIVKSDGSEPPAPPRLSTGGRYLEWSPDGTRLAFSAGSGTSPEGVWILDVEGSSGPIRLVSGVYASWSADNSQLAYTGTTGVSVIDIAPPRRITVLVKGAHHPKFRNRDQGCPKP